MDGSGLGTNVSLGKAEFQRQLAFGQIAETQISRWMMRRGWLIFPAYDIEYETGKGPRMFHEAGSIVVPDLLAIQAPVQGVLRETNGVRWIEAKHKTRFSWYRQKKVWETGIDKRHYEHYLQVGELTPWDIWLLFLHDCAEPSQDDLRKGCELRCPIGLFGGRLSYLKDRISHECPPASSGKGWGKTGMVYWAHETLRQIATLDEVLRAAS